MSRTYNLIVPSLVVSFALALASGCVAEDQETPLIILHNQAPADGCTLDPGSVLYNPRGSIDTQSEHGYLFTPLVENVSATGPNATRQQRLVQVEGANVTVQTPSGFFSDGEVAALHDSNLLEFSQPFSAFVDPDGGRTSMIFDVLPKPLLDAIGGKLEGGTSVIATVEVQLFGKHGTGEIRSKPFIYTVDVCRGCLLVDVGACAGLPMDFEASTGGACQPLQDGVLECCTEGGGLTCPARAPTM